MNLQQLYQIPEKLPENDFTLTINCHKIYSNVILLRVFFEKNDLAILFYLQYLSYTYPTSIHTQGKHLVKIVNTAEVQINI